MKRLCICLGVAFLVAMFAGCAAYDKAQDLDFSVRTDPEQFTLDQQNAGFDSKQVTSDSWEDNAAKVEDVQDMEVSYNYTNEGGDPVVVRIYVSLQQLDQQDLAQATLVHEADLQPGTGQVNRDQAVIQNLDTVTEILRESDGKFFVYTSIDTAGAIDVHIDDFRVYGDLNTDLLR